MAKVKADHTIGPQREAPSTMALWGQPPVARGELEMHQGMKGWEFRGVASSNHLAFKKHGHQWNKTHPASDTSNFWRNNEKSTWNCPDPPKSTGQSIGQRSCRCPFLISCFYADMTPNRRTSLWFILEFWPTFLQCQAWRSNTGTSSPPSKFSLDGHFGEVCINRTPTTQRSPFHPPDI